MNDTERARDLADRYWVQLLELEPTLGTEAGDERFDDRLGDPSEAGRADAEAVHRGALAELVTIDRTAVDPTQRSTIDVMEAIATRFLADLEHRMDLLHVANHFWGPAQLLGEVSSLQRTDTPERLDRFDARLRAFGPYLDAYAEVAREGVASGVTSPALVVDRSMAQIERILALDAEHSPALAAAPDDPVAQERILEAVREVVNPAYAGFLEVLREYRPHATESVGLSALADGDARYASQVLAWTTLPLDPAEVHQLGLDRFEAIQAERRDIAAGLGFDDPASAIAARTASGENTAASPEALVQLAESQVARSWEAAPAWFGTLPSANCQVRRVEPFREADMAWAFYNAPTEDGSRPGQYYINTYELEERAIHQLASVTYHESNPGHHFQIALEQEIAGRPALLRFGGGLAGSAFCEGWGLYSERLADEMGLYVDEWERLGMLDNQAHRAARLITDTGIHALGWSRDDAVATLRQSGLPQTDAEIEADRYVAIPGQALSYMVGMIEIEQARARAATREGASFVLRDFHDRVLALGQIPLPAFRREMA